MKTFTNLTSALKSALVLLVTLFTVVSATANTTGPTEPVKSVVYGSIRVDITQKSVILNWNTVSESGNNHFEIERSNDMNQFKTVAVVLDGFSTIGTGKRYAFKEDAGKVRNGQATYYRLKQFDVNGNISYSEVVKVQIDLGVQ